MSGSSKAELLATLEVKHNAIRGLTVGAFVAIAVYVFFVVIPGSIHSPALYLSLGFVLALSVGGLVTAILTAKTARRVANEE